MRALIQRVKSAEVRVAGEVVGAIGPGILTLLGIGPADGEAQVQWMIGKIAKTRIFEDDAGKMNLSLMDRAGEHLIVSQFTLYGDLKQGNRPGFSAAAAPIVAEPLYERALAVSRELGLRTAGGRFGAHMEITLVNDGPVTFWLES